MSGQELYKRVAPRTCQEFKDDFGLIWLPKKVSDFFKGDHILLHFSMINGENITVGGTVYDNEIGSLVCPDYARPDFEVWMSDREALALATSSRPVTTFVDFYKGGQIRIKAYGEDNQKKLAEGEKLAAEDDEPVPQYLRDVFSQFEG
jgi:hypothetical protein